MATLLASLKDAPFSCEKDSVKVEVRSTQDRSESLSTLMSILVDQAKQDGFRLITINTEPKRVIMACNRQGKPPNSGKSQRNIDEESDSATIDGESESAMDTDTENGSDKKKRGGRWGTSVRCQCKMRVNINYHTKINAWRITSFQPSHNHEFADTSLKDAITPQIVPGFQISEQEINEAIQKFRQMNVPMEFEGHYSDNNKIRESDAAWALTSLASFRNSPSSARNKTRLSINNLVDDQPNAKARQERFSMDQNTPLRSPQNSKRPSRIFLVKRRRSSQGPLSAGLVSPTQLPFSPSHKSAGGDSAFQYRSGYMNRRGSLSAGPLRPNHPGSVNYVTASTPVLASGGTEQSSLRDITMTAIEIDRYSMLYTQFKKLIAAACKKREYTESVLTGIGHMMERISQPSVIIDSDNGSLKNGAKKTKKDTDLDLKNGTVSESKISLSASSSSDSMSVASLVDDVDSASGTDTATEIKDRINNVRIIQDVEMLEDAKKKEIIRSDYENTDDQKPQRSDAREKAL